MYQNIKVLALDDFQHHINLAFFPPMQSKGPGDRLRLLSKLGI
jgi:hypothetical protein